MMTQISLKRCKQEYSNRKLIRNQLTVSQPVYNCFLPFKRNAQLQELINLDIRYHGQLDQQTFSLNYPAPYHCIEHGKMVAGNKTACTNTFIKTAASAERW
uniref:60S ribosomal protein L32-1 n=1 Tax=Rhizophora mucronata TaxID=61149 RepID=A0A2P2KF15_RHIMU